MSSLNPTSAPWHPNAGIVHESLPHPSDSEYNENNEAGAILVPVSAARTDSGYDSSVTVSESYPMVTFDHICESPPQWDTGYEYGQHVSRPQNSNSYPLPGGYYFGYGSISSNSFVKHKTHLLGKAPKAWVCDRIVVNSGTKCGKIFSRQDKFRHHQKTAHDRFNVPNAEDKSSARALPHPADQEKEQETASNALRLDFEERRDHAVGSSQLQEKHSPVRHVPTTVSRSAPVDYDTVGHEGGRIIAAKSLDRATDGTLSTPECSRKRDGDEIARSSFRHSAYDMRSLGKALKTGNGYHQSSRHTGSALRQHDTQEPAQVKEGHVPSGRTSPPRTEETTTSYAKSCHTDTIGLQRAPLLYRTAGSYAAPAGGKSDIMERKSDAAQSTLDRRSTTLTQQDASDCKQQLDFDPGKVQMRVFKAGYDQTCNAPSLEGLESSFGQPYLDAEDAISSCGPSTHSDQMACADESTWLDKFLDDIEDCIDGIVGSTVSQNCPSDAGGTSADSNSNDGTGNVETLGIGTSGYAGSQASFTGNSLNQGSNNQGDEDEEDDDRLPSNYHLNIPAERANVAGPPFACPYYAHNHSSTTLQSCKSGFKELFRLKEHLYRTHLQQLHCYQCKEPFESESDLEHHQQLADGCERRDHVTIFAGITKAQEKRIRDLGRKRREPNEVEKWVRIFQIIFPNAVEVPSPWNPLTDDQKAALVAVTKELKEVLPGKVEREVRESSSSSEVSPQLMETIRLSMISGIDDVYQRWTAKIANHVSNEAKVTKRRRSAVTNKRKALEDLNRRGQQRNDKTLQVPVTPRPNRARQLPSSTPDLWNGRYSSRDAVRGTVSVPFPTPSMSHGSRSDMSAEENLPTPDQTLPQQDLGSRPPIVQDVTGMQPAGLDAAFFQEGNAGENDWNSFYSPMIMNGSASGGKPPMFQGQNFYGRPAWVQMQAQNNTTGQYLSQMDTSMSSQFAQPLSNNPQMGQMQFRSHANIGNPQDARTLMMLNLSPPWNQKGSFGTQNSSNDNSGNGNFNHGGFEDGNSSGTI